MIDKPERELIGLRIVRAREYVGMTQVYVAQALGLDQGTYCRMEQGKVPLEAVVLKRLAKLFSRSTDQLLGLAPEIGELPDALKGVLATCEGLPDSDFEEVCLFADFLRTRKRHRTTKES